jgi:hypothetical protein
MKFPISIRHRKAGCKIYGKKAHYKGLATKTEAEKWFAVAPAQAGNVISLDTASRKVAQ